MSNPAKKVIRWVTNCDADRLLRQKIEDSEIPRNLKAPDIVEYWKSEAEFQKYSASVFFSHYQTIIEELETNEAIESGATAPLISTKMSGKKKVLQSHHYQPQQSDQVPRLVVKRYQRKEGMPRSTPPLRPLHKLQIPNTL